MGTATLIPSLCMPPGFTPNPEISRPSVGHRNVLRVGGSGTSDVSERITVEDDASSAYERCVLRFAGGVGGAKTAASTSASGVATTGASASTAGVARRASCGSSRRWPVFSQ